MGLGIALAVFLMMTTAGLFLSIGKVNPDDGQVVAESQPYLEARFLGFPVAGQMLVDARPIAFTMQRFPGRVVGLPGPLSEGSHTVVLDLRTALGRRARKVWQVRVDRQGPGLTLESPADGEVTGKEELEVQGHSEPGSRVRINDQEVRADGGGQFSLSLTLKPGENTLTVSAVDEAGNTETLERGFYCDLTPPEVKVISPKEGEHIKKAPPTVTLAIQEDRGLKDIVVTVDGKEYKSQADEESGQFHISLGNLAQGERQLTVMVEDLAGHLIKHERTVVVDTSETFGEANLTRGAVGADVKGLQKRLHKLGFLEQSDINGQFDETTLSALKRYQTEEGLEPDGTVGPQVLASLGPRIYVNLARFGLVLEDPMAAPRRFGIAHGMLEHPTPTGKFRIVEKIKNPEWIPPDSPWAREAKLTPPGPDNPLGTRWLGLDSNLVGLHGTPFPGTIGTRSSHGCVRLKITDIEALYELVNVGTPVTIFAGSEDDPNLERLWP
ncbi:MAG: L,D-transpeptidase family protein [Vulcanimicrobiota bacterium]